MLVYNQAEKENILKTPVLPYKASLKFLLRSSSIFGDSEKFISKLSLKVFY